MNREHQRRIERLEGENRALKADLERYRRASLNGGSLTRLVRLYDDLALAADPVRGRAVESSSSQHPFDRPLPYLASQTARAQLHIVDRAVHRLADWIDRQMDDTERKPPGDACPACGGRVDRQGRPPNRRRMARLFLEKNLQGGSAFRDDTIRWAATQLGISKDTLRRAADELGVRRWCEDNVWWWQLQQGEG
jgi:hypothetical protein